MTVRHDGLDIEWRGYATVRLDGPDQTIYLDPGRYGVVTGEWEPDTPGVSHPPGRDYRPRDGDVVCLTHVHHYDPDAIERVIDTDGTVLACEGIDARQSRRDIPRFVDLDCEVQQTGTEDEHILADTPLWTVPAYNDPDGPHTRPDGSPFHPEGRGCGFLLGIDGTRVFWPGDTDVLEGHAELDVDVFLPPIGGAFTMDRHEAATLAEALDPELVVPVHYNTFEALETDSAAFAEELADRSIAVELDEK